MPPDSILVASPHGIQGRCRRENLPFQASPCASLQAVWSNEHARGQGLYFFFELTMSTVCRLVSQHILYIWISELWPVCTKKWCTPKYDSQLKKSVHKNWANIAHKQDCQERKKVVEIQACGFPQKRTKNTILKCILWCNIFFLSFHLSLENWCFVSCLTSCFTHLFEEKDDLFLFLLYRPSVKKSMHYMRESG